MKKSELIRLLQEHNYDSKITVWSKSTGQYKEVVRVGKSLGTIFLEVE